MHTDMRSIYYITKPLSFLYKNDVLILVHKRMFYIRMNLRMLQHSNVECNIRMLILCNKMMYFGDFVVLVEQWIYIYHLINMNTSWFLYKNYILGMHALACRFMY